MTTPADRLTVVIPVLDDAEHLEQCLRSLLDQEGGPPSIVVVDDGSQDGSSDVAAAVAPDARLLATEARASGPSRARNLGVAASTTPLLSFLDADDAWPQGRLLADLALFDADPTLESVMGRTTVEVETPDLMPDLLLDDRGSAAFWHLAAMSIRREAWFAVGPLDESLRRGEDTDWFYRAVDHGHFPHQHDAISLVYRRRHDSYTQGGKATQRERLELMLHMLRRRRAEGIDQPQVLTPPPPTSELPPPAPT